jgi:hypothetical protein
MSASIAWRIVSISGCIEPSFHCDAPTFHETRTFVKTEASQRQGKRIKFEADSHELRELRETDGARGNSKDNPDAKTEKKEHAVSLMFSRHLLFLSRSPAL